MTDGCEESGCGTTALVFDEKVFLRLKRRCFWGS